MKKIVAGLLAFTLILSMTAGCSGKTKTTTKRNEKPAPTEPVVEIPDTPTVKRDNGKEAVFELQNAGAGKTALTSEELNEAYSEFIFTLMKKCAEESNGENVLISADSILIALEMVVAGADGETLNQMMNTLVPGADNGAAFQFSVDRMNSLKNDSLQIANSIWLNQARSANVYDDYLDYVVGHFDAGVSVIPFDANAVKMINGWTEEKTKGRIKELLEDLDPNSLMVLVNAITFDAKWQEPYEDAQVYSDVFTTGSGKTKTVPFLSSTESVYLCNDEAAGFIKAYDDGKYAFMTILPNDASVDINAFMADMTAEEYWEFWNSRENFATVQARMPEFKSEYSVELNKVLIDMGMSDVFDESRSDLTNLCKNNAYISKVVHKTFIEVDRAGTKAAAATAVVAVESECMEPEDVKYVICDRPYAYAIVDMTTGLPVFLGTVETF